MVTENLSQMSWWALLLVFVIYTVQFPISVWKWKVALKIHQIDYSFLFLLKILSIGFFFNNFLPTSIGGDAYRIIKTMPEEGYKSRSVSAVLLERIIGFAALLILGSIGGAITLLYESNTNIKTFLLICILGAIATLAVIMLLKLGFFGLILERLRNIKKLDFILHNMGHIWRNPVLVSKVIMISIFFQLLAILAIGLLFDALSVNAGYEKYALIAATVGLASILPLSINGIGVIEGAFAISAVQLGIGYNEAIIVAFVLRILVLPLSLICGLIYLFDSKQEKKFRSENITG